jgi:hypothetical protein
VGRRSRLSGELGWRWRRSPLRRRTDVVEAWLGVLTALLFCLVPLVGWWTGHSVDRGLQRVVRAQRAERVLVTATVLPARAPAAGRAVTGPAGGTAAADAASQSRGAAARRGDRLRWTAPDHSVHTATVPVELQTWHDGKVSLWTDRTGEPVPPPLDSATATTHSVLAGTAVATAAGGLLLISHRVLAWHLMRRRLDSWEQDWARVSQDWGRTGAGG